MQWYYAKNGAQVGPVEEDALHDLAQRGELRPDDLVWNPTLGGTWAAARTVPGLFPSLPPAMPQAGMPSAAPAAVTAPTPGTGGQTPNATLTRRAREALRGQWGLAIGFTVLMWLMMFAASLVVAFIPGAPLLLSLLTTGPLMVGMYIFFLHVTRRGQPQLGQMFAGFHVFGPAVGAYLLVSLFVFLWMMLLLVPIGVLAALVVPLVAKLNSAGDFSAFSHPAAMGGLIALGVAAYVLLIVAMMAIYLRYSLTFFVLADHPQTGPLEAVRRSVALMRGRKGKLFCLYCRFIGWGLLAVLSCGIGFLWVTPYAIASTACFYDDVAE